MENPILFGATVVRGRGKVDTMMLAMRRVGAGAVARSSARMMSEAAREQMIIFDTTLRDGEQTPGLYQSQRVIVSLAHIVLLHGRTVGEHTLPSVRGEASSYADFPSLFHVLNHHFLSIVFRAWTRLAILAVQCVSTQHAVA